MNRAHLKTTLAWLLCTLSLSGNASAGEKPNRIVTVGGAVTEIVYALNSQAQLVGVDTTSLWPTEAKTLPQVGYMRNLSAEGVLSLRPDAVIGSSHAGPPTVLEQLRGAGLTISTIDEHYSEQGVLDKIDAIAGLLGKTEQGAQLASAVRSDFRQLAEFRDRQHKRPKTLFIMAIVNGEPLVSGRDTPADAVIGLAGGANAASEIKGNKAIGSEAMIAAGPDVIVLTDISINAMGGLERCYELPGIALTPAGRDRRLIVADTLPLLGFGLRTGSSILSLAQQLHRSPVTDALAD